MTGNRSYVAAFADVAPPAVALTAPNGGESWPQGSHQTIQWSATDNEVVARVDLSLSRTGQGGPYDTLAADVPNTGSFDWVVSGTPTSDAFVAVAAHDSAGNVGADTSNAAFAITGTTAVDDAPVTTLELSPVSPNPVRQAARISFALPRAARVHLGVLDVEGRETAVLADGSYGPGRYHVAWPGRPGVQNAGLYFIRLTVGDRTLVRRAVLIR